MTRMQPAVGRLVFDDSGQDLIEYGLLAALIAAVAVAGVSTVGQVIATVFWEVIAHAF